MASIQQSLNQLLTTSTLAAGLYTRSPAYEKREKEKYIQGLAEFAEASDYETEPLNELEQAQLDFAKKFPTEENLSRVEEIYSGRRQEAFEKKHSQQQKEKKEQARQAEINKKAEQQYQAEREALRKQAEIAEQQRQQTQQLKWREDFLRAGRNTIPTDYTRKE